MMVKMLRGIIPRLVELFRIYIIYVLTIYNISLYNYIYKYIIIYIFNYIYNYIELYILILLFPNVCLI
jgi:hypothetical protein